MFGNIASIGHTNIFVYGAFVFIHVYALTEFMDRNPNAWIMEFGKNAAAIYWILNTGSWFGLTNLISWSNYLMIAYFAITSIAVYLFSIGFTSKKMSIV